MPRNASREACRWKTEDHLDLACKTAFRASPPLQCRFPGGRSADLQRVQSRPLAELRATSGRRGKSAEAGARCTCELPPDLDPPARVSSWSPPAASRPAGVASSPGNFNSGDDASCRAFEIGEPPPKARGNSTSLNDPDKELTGTGASGVSLTEISLSVSHIRGPSKSLEGDA